jgi:hypothetical protein
VASEAYRGTLDCVFEGRILERVQGVVVNKDADGPLRGQQPGGLVDRVSQRREPCADAGTLWTETIRHAVVPSDRLPL